MPPTFPAEMPCQPWTTPDKMCCPDETFVDDPCTPENEAGPATYVWTDTEIIEMVSNILFRRTCSLYPGTCPVELRPCEECGCPEHRCGCRYNVVPLAGRYPVLEVTEVRIDGSVVPASSYRLDEFARLVRIDGDVWPRRQDLSADPLSDSDTFLIKFNVGRPVPIELQSAAALLACEFKRACNGQGCRLPDNIASIAREGVTYEIEQAHYLRPDFPFLIPEVDVVLKQYDCSKPTLRNRLLHPLIDDDVYPGVRG